MSSSLLDGPYPSLTPGNVSMSSGYRRSLFVTLALACCELSSHDRGGAGPGGSRRPAASKRCLRSLGRGGGVSGCDKSCRIWGGRVGVTTDAGGAAGLTWALRRVVINSLTVGGASLSGETSQLMVESGGR
jgi:hypothetical protein